MSIHIEAVMNALNTKWADWLGNPGIGYGGLVSTYEGAMYSEFGIYRPTFDSKMRSLNQPFNLVSIEGLIIEFYKIVDPIDDSTSNNETLDGTENLFVDPVDPVGHVLRLRPSFFTKRWLMRSKSTPWRSAAVRRLRSA